MEPEFRSAMLHDYTTLGGKFRIFLNRLSWKWILPGMFFVALVTWSIAFDKKPTPTPGDPLTDATRRILLQPSPSHPIIQEAIIDPSPSLLKAILPPSAPDSKRKKYKARANESPDEPLYTKFNPLTGILTVAGVPGEQIPFPSASLLALLTQTNSSKLSVLEVEVRNVEINAPEFSAALQGLTNIRRLNVEGVTTVGGNYSRVHLPLLKQFLYHQLRTVPKIVYKTREAYRSAEELKSILFFELKEGQGAPGNSTWDMHELLNLDMDVRVRIGGTTLVDMNKDDGLLSLNVQRCEDYLKAADDVSWVKRLTLSWCNTTFLSSYLTDKVTYLNLNNASPKSSSMEEIVKKGTGLEEFHASLPYLCENASWISPAFPELQVELNLVNFPPSLANLTLSKLQVTAHPLPPSGLPGVRSLFIEQSNVTGIVEHFPLLFPNLKRFALANLTHSDDAYRILDSVLKMETVDWMLLEGFKRRPTTPFEEGLERALDAAGVAPTATDFLLERLKGVGGDRSSDVGGHAISEYEKDLYRFTLLGYQDVDDYADYLRWDAHWNPHW